MAALLLLSVTYPAWIATLLDRLGGTLVPLALVSVGFQIQFGESRGRVRELILGLAFKLIAAPMVFGLLYAGLFGGRGEMIQITLVQAAGPPLIVVATV